MGNDFNNFSQRLRQISSNILVNAVELQKDIAQQVLSEVAASTPIDTGRAMSNWKASSGSPDTEFMPEAFTPGDKGTTRSQNFAQVLHENDPKIAQHKQGLLFISNNTPYIGELNAEHTPLFVQAAVMRASKLAINRILTSDPRVRRL